MYSTLYQFTRQKNCDAHFGCNMVNCVILVTLLNFDQVTINATSSAFFAPTLVLSETTIGNNEWVE